MRIELAKITLVRASQRTNRIRANAESIAHPLARVNCRLLQCSGMDFQQCLVREKRVKYGIIPGHMEPLPPYRKRNKKQNITGHAHFLTFSCLGRMALLSNDVWREWLAESIRAKCDMFDIALWAYVFMPEHVHLLLKPRRELYDLAKFEQSAKLSWSRKMIVQLGRSNSRLLERCRVDDGYKLWQEGGGHDLNIWSMRKATEKAAYCHVNPVKRGLVGSPEKWRWSSFRWLELGKRESEPLRVDDWDESLLDEEPEHDASV